MTGIRFEYSRVFLPAINDALVKSFPSQRLEMFGKNKGVPESEHIRFQVVQSRAAKNLGRGFLDGMDAPLGLTICPEVMGLGQLAKNAVFIDHAEMNSFSSLLSSKGNYLGITPGDSCGLCFR
ncbi:hypothetical protein [Polaromonas sp. CG_9.11]|uniref:hypothetical protein n=1 Tax=Polaromonas sp. CG_9.11 TaxID=2787730 RepID=UPI001E3DBB60|nr:hypothetical protein [Polaromonas sp. CG_9.11]